MDPNGFKASTGRPGTGRVSREAFATMTQVQQSPSTTVWRSVIISPSTRIILVKPLRINFPLCPLSLMQVDEEKKVEAVREFYTNLGSFSIVDKLQIVSKY